MKKCKKVALFFVIAYMLTGYTFAMDGLTELTQLITISKTPQGLVGTIHKDSLGGYAYYQQDSTFCTNAEAEADLKALCEAEKQRQLKLASNCSGIGYRYISRQLFSAAIFHSLVTASTLNDKELIENSKNYHAINGRDTRGCTPLHILAIRPDAKISHVKALLERGARLTIRTNIICKDGEYLLGDYACEAVIEYEGHSPADKPLGRFFNDQCVGNPEVVLYLHYSTLYERLEDVQKEYEKKAKKAAYNKGVKYQGTSPANEPVGKFFEKQCDAKTIKELFSGVLYEKLEKIHKQQEKGVAFMKTRRQKKWQKVTTFEMKAKKRFLVQDFTT